MVKKAISCTINRIIAPLNEVNSSNSQKVVAEAAWGDAPDTINIRNYNTVDEMLLKGISLTHEEAATLVYALIADQSIPVDVEKLKDMIDIRENEVVDIAKVVADGSIPDEDVIELDADIPIDDTDAVESRTVGHYRLVVKDNAPKWARKFGSI